MKPQMKQEVAIRYVGNHLIMFYATNDAMADFVEFGDIILGLNRNEWWLTVDARYDMDEVVDYISNYGKE